MTTKPTDLDTQDLQEQARCYDLPNDAPEGHYWSWRNAPNSVPNQYRECMTCGRVDASEWLAQREQAAELRGLALAHYCVEDGSKEEERINNAIAALQATKPEKGTS